MKIIFKKINVNNFFLKTNIFLENDKNNVERVESVLARVQKLVKWAEDNIHCDCISSSTSSPLFSYLYFYFSFLF